MSFIHKTTEINNKNNNNTSLTPVISDRKHELMLEINNIVMDVKKINTNSVSGCYIVRKPTTHVVN